MSTTKDNLRSLMTISYSAIGAIRADGGPASGLTPEVLLQLSDMIWTTKDLSLGNQEFIVGYKLDVPLMASRIGITAEMLKFRITYIRRSAIVAMTPHEEFAPAAIKELGKQDAKPLGTQADRTRTLSNAKQIALGIIMLNADSDDIYPYVQGTPQLLKMIEPYTKNTEIFKSLNPAGGTWRFNMSLAGVSETDIAEPANTVLLYESEAWADGKRVVAYADGHAKVVSSDEWQKLLPTLQLKLKRHGKPIPPQVK